jgi:hypothetical protein
MLCQCSALHVKVGDFNLSRYMSLGVSYVKSSLEINPVSSSSRAGRFMSVLFAGCLAFCCTAHAIRNEQPGDQRGERLQQQQGTQF